MTKKPRIVDNNEGNERGCRPDRPNRPKKNRSDGDYDIYMTKIE